ncbi:MULTISPECIES: mannitol dehydrogenase family protein [Thalassospira]|uniref:Mannitol dehydrogenase family protein n=1 Tax=Thalassospira aquimaris TaxID=3037796 RepID=A0ABT6G769_9PROT|nr:MULTISPECIES: mannitol dehydrogenase family protein [Thalassospira]MDG4717825.1 mannitol dehydrogenase family protein [Thalassospira sp. FZY0004]
MSIRIVQFGTSRFLQAHADLILSESSDHKIAMVETTGSAASKARIAAINEHNSFPIAVRGLRNGHEVNETLAVSSVQQGLSAREDYAQLRRIFVDDADYVISNTGDNGFKVPDRTNLSATGWSSFVELLTILLFERFSTNGRPVTLLPCELVTNNGLVLRNTVIELAKHNKPGDTDFLEWLEHQCLWMNSLVDRIVSEPLEPIGAVAEPYALWAIENQTGFVSPAHHEDLVIVDDLRPVARKKLHMLNLAHTLLAQKWIEEQRPKYETVYEILQDPSIFRWLDHLIKTEVVPAFAPDEANAAAYWDTCLERFQNPFLAHRISDIAQNHEAKVARRIESLWAWRSDLVFDGLRAAIRSLETGRHS